METLDLLQQLQSCMVPTRAVPLLLPLRRCCPAASPALVPLLPWRRRRRAHRLPAGSWAPLVGCLMEVNRAVRLMDGKLLVLATAVARIRVRAPPRRNGAAPALCIALLQA